MKKLEQDQVPTTLARRLDGPIGDFLMGVDEVAAATGISNNAIYTGLCRGSFPLIPMKVGRRLRWRASDVQAFIKGGAE